jgi:hypothetical protein
MRHVKLRPGQDINTKALTKLIQNAYSDMKRREQFSSPRSGERQ